ncbi:TPA: hypothetical protein ACWSRY_003164 [Escherichia coli]
MTRKLIYTQDSVGEYTIADETEKWVTLVGQVESESDARLFCAAPELLGALRDMVALVKSRAYPQSDKPSSDWGRAEAAEDVIRKATGETK